MYCFFITHKESFRFFELTKIFILNISQKINYNHFLLLKKYCYLNNGLTNKLLKYRKLNINQSFLNLKQFDTIGFKMEYV